MTIRTCLLSAEQAAAWAADGVAPGDDPSPCDASGRLCMGLSVGLGISKGRQETFAAAVVSPEVADEIEAALRQVTVTNLQWARRDGAGVATLLVRAWIGSAA